LVACTQLKKVPSCGFDVVDKERRLGVLSKVDGLLCLSLVGRLGPNRAFTRRPLHLTVAVVRTASKNLHRELAHLGNRWGCHPFVRRCLVIFITCYKVGSDGGIVPSLKSFLSQGSSYPPRSPQILKLLFRQFVQEFKLEVNEKNCRFFHPRRTSCS